MASQLGNLSVVAASAQLNDTAPGCNIASSCDIAENDNSAPFYKPAQLPAQLSNTAPFKPVN